MYMVIVRLNIILAFIFVIGCQSGSDPLGNPLREAQKEEYSDTIAPYLDGLRRSNIRKLRRGNAESGEKKSWYNNPDFHDNRNAWRDSFKKKLKSFSHKWVRTSFLPLRSEPSIYSEIKGQLFQGDRVWVQSIINNWARLKSGAYVPLSSLSSFPPEYGNIGEDLFFEENLRD